MNNLKGHIALNLAVNYAARRKIHAKLPIESYPGRSVQVVEINPGNFMAVEVEAIGTNPPRFFAGRAGIDNIAEAFNFALSLQGYNLVVLPRYTDEDPEGEDITAELNRRIESAYPI